MKIIHRKLTVGKPPYESLIDDSYYCVKGKKRSISKRDILSAIQAPMHVDPNIEQFYNKKGVEIEVIIDDPTTTPENVKTKYPEYFI